MRRRRWKTGRNSRRDLADRMLPGGWVAERSIILVFRLLFGAPLVHVGGLKFLEVPEAIFKIQSCSSKFGEQNKSF